MKKYEQIVYDEANQSKCVERQVGAVLVNNRTCSVLGQGHNYSPSCNCKASMTCPKDVIHAEVACIADAESQAPFCKRGDIVTMYITQPPCNQCLLAIAAFEEKYGFCVNIEICEQFLKFDDDKIRFELLPPEWEEALAKVLTYGAKKYKPDNWRKGEIKRYHGAVMRHWNLYRQGEILDPDTGMPHLWHMFTNVGFLITLEEEKNEN